MAESWKIKLLRWRFNWYPAWRNSGARVIHLAEDLLEVRIRLPLNRHTRNLHGTIYGGAIYAAVDPMHAVLLAYHLGPDFYVWMKSARIEFRRPGRSALFATARLTHPELAEIRAALVHESKIDREFSLTLADAAGEVSARVFFTIHLKRRPVHERPMDAVVFQKT